MAVAKLHGIQNEVVNNPRVSTPDTHSYQRHLVPTAKRHCLLLHILSFCVKKSNPLNVVRNTRS